MKKLNIILVLIQIGIILFAWRSLPPQLPLFYSRPWGSEQLTYPTGLLILPGVSLLVFSVNFFFLSLIPKQEKLLQKILMSTSTIFSLLCLITLIQIIKLVT